MEFIKKYFVELINLSNEMAPYLLLGFIFAGILPINKKLTNIWGKKLTLS